ncbi:proline-rich protein 36-like [Ctenopharyngodon idella]|uniref:proline-rich protein 36-like n=1 Tax=Ctenopharyngodon idella TaxID=7959 RepID=UPI00222F82CF|nr:proline-rich protein 36-like [Ctenopharyngodon idella]
MLLEPTADCGDQPPVRDEPVPRIRTEPFIALEPGPLTVSDQVREPATPVVAKGVIVEIKGWEESPAHTTTAVDVSLLSSGHYLEELKDLSEADLIDFFGEVFPNSPVSPAPPISPESPVSPAPVSPVSLLFPESLPSLSLPPPRPTSSSAPPSLLSFSPSSSLCQIPTVFCPPAPSHTEGAVSPPQASVPPAPPRTVDTPVPPWLLPPSASPASLVFPAPPWSVVRLPAPMAPSGSPFPPDPPTSSVPLAQPLSSGRPSSPQMLVAMAPPRSPVPSAACGLFGSSATSGSPSLATSPLVVPRVLSANASTPPRLLPPATPPWGLVMVGLWTNIWLLLLRVSSWLLPPSTPPWTISLDCVLFCLPLFSSPSSRATTELC